VNVAYDDQRDAELVEVARRIGKSQREREVRLVLLSSLITLAAILIFGLVSLAILTKILNDIQDQAEAIDQSVADARVAQATEQQQLERILAGIEERLIPRSDIIQLQAEVEELQGDVEGLQRTNRQLTKAVNDLTGAVAQAQQPQSGGG
jgi:type II secretory pathway pseudopilin PulG